MRIIAGLGNPGIKYEYTRHNTGFRVIDELAGMHGIRVEENKYGAFCGKGVVEGEKALLMKPQTFMNLSGGSIRDAVSFYKADPVNDLIVIYDDIDLPVGKLRIRAKGSAGGHNGMKDIIANLGTDRFTRIRVGVGARPEDWNLADWVLSKITDEEEQTLKDVRIKAAEAVGAILSEGVGYAMSRFNG